MYRSAALHCQLFHDLYKDNSDPNGLTFLGTAGICHRRPVYPSI